MNRRQEACAAAAFCAAFAGLSAYCARVSSATFDEPAHLAAGFSYLRWGDYRLNPEHPPLLKQWAALPLLLLSPWPDSPSPERIRIRWERAFENPLAQWAFAHEFLYGIRDETLRRFGAKTPAELPTTAALGPSDFHNDADSLLFWGRAPMILLGALLALLIYAWARELYGASGGLLALALYCLDPNFIAHAGLITNDVGVSAFLLGSAYFLWRAFARLGAFDAAAAAVCWALAVASKSSALLFIPAALILGAAHAASAKPWPTAGRALRSRLEKSLAAAALLALLAASSYAALWAVYGFRFSAARDPGRNFPLSEVLQRTSPGGLDAAGRLLSSAHRRRLAPEAYLYGLAYARQRSLKRASFLGGLRFETGRWDYFPLAFVLKTPLVELALLAAALGLGWRRRRAWAFLLLAPALYFMFAMASDLNIGHRHLLPVYPFLFVLCGGLAPSWSQWPARRRRAAAFCAAAALALRPFLVFSPPWRPAVVYPHCLAYFNELAGGPRNGYRWLVDSNLDWGQELLGLRAWLARNKIDEPINLCYFGTADPRYYGIRHLNLAGGYAFEAQQPLESARAPGWLAISATNVQGVFFEPGLRQAWENLLRRAVFADAVGYSLFIYRLGPPPPR